MNDTSGRGGARECGCKLTIGLIQLNRIHMNLLEGQIIIITGASSGLGEQLARALAAVRAIPVLAARRADRLARLQSELPGVDAVTCDVTDAGERDRLVETVIDRHGRLDGLINNAGVGATAPA